MADADRPEGPGTPDADHLDAAGHGPAQAPASEPGADSPWAPPATADAPTDDVPLYRDDLPDGADDPDPTAAPRAMASDETQAFDSVADTDDPFASQPRPVDDDPYGVAGLSAEDAVASDEETPMAAAPQRARTARAAAAVTGARAAVRRRTGGSLVLTILTWIGIAFLALAVIGALTFGYLWTTTRVPDPNADALTNVSQVYFRDGKEPLGDFAAQNRRSLSYAEMPQNIKTAVVDGENETFWEDSGISIAGLARAVTSAVGPGDTVGGSTITQQWVKVSYLTQEKTLTRKATEIILALKATQEKSKEEILQGYLNTVYFGRGAYGIQTAAQAYFAVDAKDLSTPQAIALAAIINSPGNLDPAKGEKHRKDLLERYQYIINQEVKLGHMTEAEKAKIYWTLPDFPKIQTDPRFGGPKGHLLRAVQVELEANGFSEAEINGGGLKVITTIDSKLQDAAVQAAQRQAERIAKAQPSRVCKATPEACDPLFYHPAIASVDTATGGILAMYGGPDYIKDYTNYATVARPAGSTFKPWALVAGLRDGVSLNDRFNGNEFTPRGEKKPITNAGGSNYGPVGLQEMTTNSINSAYVDMVSQMKDGPNKVIKAAEDVGVNNPGWEPVIGLPLGAGEVSPMDAARGLATLVNEGKRTNPHVLAEVRSAEGHVLWQAPKVADQVVDKAIAQTAVAVLTGVTEDGTGRRAVAGIRHEVAGKTGTYYVSADDATYATWFIGATKQISTAFVLTAGPQARSNLGGNVYGSTYAAPGWNDYMKVALEGVKPIDFPGPANLKGSGKFRAPVVPAPAPVTRAPAPVQPAAPAPAPTTAAPAPTSAPPAEPAPSAPAPSAPAPTQPPKPSIAPTTKADKPGNPTPPGKG